MLHLQGNLKLTRNRESRLQRLQDSLQQLVEEKDSKLNNGAINSRASVERSAALQNRIEELENQLADRQVQKWGSNAVPKISAINSRRVLGCLKQSSRLECIIGTFSFNQHILKVQSCKISCDLDSAS